MEFAYEKHLLWCTRVWCIGALVHLVHWCNICEIDSFFNRRGHQGIHLKLNAPGTTGPNQVLLNGICL